MECSCEKLADGLIELTLTCLGHLWIFKDLEENERKALSDLRAFSVLKTPRTLLGQPHCLAVALSSCK